MAYAAIISLKHTIERLLKCSHVSIVPSSPEIMKFAYKEILSLLEVIQGLNNNSSRERLNALDGQIREAVCRLEDVIESHVLSNHFLSQPEETLRDEGCSLIDLGEIRQEIDSFTQTVKMMKEDYVKELRNPSPDEVKDDAVSLSRTDSGVKKSNLVGLSGELQLFQMFIADGMHYEREILQLVGMAGIGKTTLAKELFEDPFIFNVFDCCAWVTIGPNYQLKQIVQDILGQVNPPCIDEILGEGDDERLAELISKRLEGRKYLIVLDDVWEKQVWEELAMLLPDDNNGSRILLTTRLQEVADSNKMHYVQQMSLLTEEDSWYLLCKEVFGEDSCPYSLEKAGKKIAENCEGLPLLIITVAKLLSKGEKTPEYWNKVAEKQNSVFTDAYDEILKVLLPSFEYLPQHLKACFLYMGVFPQSYEITCSNLVKLWSAEGFLEPTPPTTIEHFSVECLEELVSKNLVMIRQKSSNDGIKTFSVHSVFWHLCKSEGGKSKFLHVLNSYADGLAESIKNQRRLCVHNNILLGIKDVYDSVASISTVRSLLCTGPYHQYPVPICLDLLLLKVLDALTIRLYEFPMEVIKLVQLRYLALTFNGDLPPLFKLWNLQYFIVRRHLSIKSFRDPLYLPMEIWDMKELKHLQIMGSNLPDPFERSLLPNLLTLLDVGIHSCTKSVFERIPNLQKLGIQIELASDAVESLRCFDHISHLHKLESLKCVIANPIFKSEVVAPPPPLSVFPSNLQKLSLSGFGYPWEDMRVIESLPNLKVLKLRCNAFRGSKWEIEKNGFLQLEYLLIEDTDLVHWRVRHGSFPQLNCLCLKHCYKLKDLNWEFGESLRSIELVDCNPVAVTNAKVISSRYGRYAPPVRVHSSWEDSNLKS